MTDKELIKKICQAAPAGEGMADHVADKLAEVRLIQSEVQSYHRRRQAMLAAHREALANLDIEHSDRMKFCEHLDTTYHGDPAGGSDSHTICNICGREI